MSIQVVEEVADRSDTVDMLDEQEVEKTLTAALEVA